MMRGVQYVKSLDVTNFVEVAKQKVTLEHNENSTPSPSCYFQGATISLLHNHLHVVEDKVESHAPNRLHRLLHEPAEKRLIGKIKEKIRT